MKLLIRTITIATIGLFLILISLHATIVEVSKHELEVASDAALSRTLDAWEKNRKLISEGETTNLYFTNNEEYYWYFYDSLAVQLTGNIDVAVLANAIDYKTGLLDIDTTISFRGLDRKERSYTVHADSYGKLTEWVDDSPERQNMLKEIANIPKGAKVEYKGKTFYMLDPNSNDAVMLLSNEQIGPINYTSEYSSYKYAYEYSNLHRLCENWTREWESIYNTTVEEKWDYKETLAETTLTDTNISDNGLYNENVEKAVVVSGAFVNSINELEGYTGPITHSWTRTMRPDSNFYASDGSTQSVDEGSSLVITPAVRLAKAKIEDLEIEKGDYVEAIDWTYIIK